MYPPFDLNRTCRVYSVSVYSRSTNTLMHAPIVFLLPVVAAVVHTRLMFHRYNTNQRCHDFYFYWVYPAEQRLPGKSTLGTRATAPLIPTLHLLQLQSPSSVRVSIAVERGLVLWKIIVLQAATWVGVCCCTIRGVLKNCRF